MHGRQIISRCAGAFVVGGLFGPVVLLLAACGGGASNAAGTTAATTAPTLDSYVANVCKAVADLDAAASQPGTPAASADAGTPGANAGARAGELLTAANGFLDALRADGPPAELQDYNTQLVSAVQTAVDALASGSGGGPGFAGRNGTPFAGTPGARANRTPGARPSGAPFTGANGTPFPRASGTPGAGFAGRGGGVSRLLLRNLPTPPQADAAQLNQDASANADCQSAGFTFATN